MAWAERGQNGFRGRYRDAQRNTHQVRDADGRARYFATKKQARQAALDEEAKIRQGRWWNPDTGAVTFADYFENHWRPNKVVEVTTLRKYDDRYRSSNWGLKQYWGQVQLRHITRTAVQTWVASMVKAGVRPSVVQTRFKHFQTVLAGGTVGTRRKGTSALREGLIASNPCVGIELPVVPKPEKKIYAPDDVQALIAAMEPWHRPIQQIWRDHLLLLSMQNHANEWTKAGCYILVYPARNTSFSDATQAYRQLLVGDDTTFGA